jgi:hypothetical protein
MKHLLPYKNFNEGFNLLEGAPKLSTEFLQKCNSILDDINIMPSLHNKLITLAKKVRHVEAEEGGNKELGAFADELKSAFPGTDPYDGEFINTGISIPFYGPTKVGFNNSGKNGRMVTVAGYIIDKLQKKYNKYE